MLPAASPALRRFLPALADQTRHVKAASTRHTRSNPEYRPAHSGPPSQGPPPTAAARLSPANVAQLAEYLIIARRRPTLIRQQPEGLAPRRSHRVLVNRGRIRRGQARQVLPDNARPIRN
jgi:hypothetical protein